MPVGGTSRDAGTTTGARALVQALVAHGVDHAFCVPGESYLAVLDALHDAPSIELTVCRQEGGAAMMAEAHGKLTGRPGICFVTRGPGATNASAGVHIASQDSTPMILFVGQVARGMMEREAFQEIDYRRMFGQMTKWVAEVDDAARIPELVSRAFRVAVAGRPGPVVLALPEDMLTEPAPSGSVPACAPAVPHPDTADVARAVGMIRESRRPFLLLGGSGWTPGAWEAARTVSENWSLPVGTAFRRQDRFDNEHPNYAGDVGLGINPELAQRIRDSDLLIAVGPRLGETTTGGYTLVDLPVPRQRFIHVHPDPEEIGRVYTPTLGMASGVGGFLEALAQLPAESDETRREWARAANASYRAWSSPITCPGDVQLAAIVASLREHLPDDTIVTNGAGNYAGWIHRFHRYRRLGTQLGPTSGSMGYGVPAGVAAARRYPGRQVIAFAGDGCFLMHGQELATAVQYALPLVVLVANNGMYGTIRMHQERDYPGREIATALRNPDFAALARAYGATGEAVERTEDFVPALRRALAAGGPALIELRVDPEAIAPGRTLSQIREAGTASTTADLSA